MMTEGETKETVEEMTPAVVDEPTEKKSKDETEGETKERVEEMTPAVVVEEMTPAVVDEPTEKKSKDELWEECESLQNELTTVQRMYFKAERDKARRYWENSKRNLEKIKGRMREKLRLKQEAEKCRQAEIEEYQQKLTQLGNAHHSDICELKMATIAVSSKTNEEHVESEVWLQKKLHLLQADRGEKESHTDIYIRELQQKERYELLELNESYKEQAREMEVRYENKIKKMFNKTKAKTQTELNDIDQRMSTSATNIMQEHDKAWKSLQKYIKNEHGVGLERKRLERELEDEKETDKRLDQRMAAAVQRNNRLKQSLQEMEQKLSESRQELTVQRKAMAKRLKRSNRITARILKERRDLYVKNQQLELKQEQAQQEYDELQRKQTEAILDLQQKGDLKVLVLERKIEAIAEILEKEQLKLWVALAFGQGDQTAAKNITELSESKHATMKALKDDISRLLTEHDNLVKKATACKLSVDKGFSTGGFQKSIRKALEESEKFDDLMQELTALHIVEDKSVQKDTL